MSVKHLLWAPEGTEVNYVDDLMVLEYGPNMYDLRAPWIQLGRHNGAMHFSEWHRLAETAANPDDAPAAAHGAAVATRQLPVDNFRYIRIEHVTIDDNTLDLEDKQMIAMAVLWQEQFAGVKGYFFPRIIVQSVSTMGSFNHRIRIDGMMLDDSVFIGEKARKDNNEDSIGKGARVDSVAPPRKGPALPTHDEPRGDGV